MGSLAGWYLTDEGGDLRGAYFESGVEFVFEAGAIEELWVLAPGERMLVVANVDDFRVLDGDEVKVLGRFSGSLANGGEGAALVGADGEGYSLVRVADEEWRRSVELDGNPGESDVVVWDGGRDEILVRSSDGDEVKFVRLKAKIRNVN